MSWNPRHLGNSAQMNCQDSRFLPKHKLEPVNIHRPKTQARFHAHGDETCCPFFGRIYDFFGMRSIIH